MSMVDREAFKGDPEGFRQAIKDERKRERREKLQRRLKDVALYAGGAGGIVFFLATFAAVADPHGGWAPWRVGMLAGIIVFMVIGLVGCVILMALTMDES